MGCLLGKMRLAGFVDEGSREAHIGPGMDDRGRRLAGSDSMTHFAGSENQLRILGLGGILEAVGVTDSVYL